MEKWVGRGTVEKGKTHVERNTKTMERKGTMANLSFLCLYGLFALLCIVVIFADLLVLVDLETSHDLDHCFYSSGECSYLNHYSILGFQRVIQLRATFFVFFF